MLAGAGPLRMSARSEWSERSITVGWMTPFW